MEKLKLSELIELESELHKRRVAEELQSICTYREAQQDLGKEFDFDAAKAYLTRRGYSSAEIDSALKGYAKNELVACKEAGLTNLEDAIAILEKERPDCKARAKEIYDGLNETRIFMLKYIRSRNLELSFASKINGIGANVKIAGMPKFVSIGATCIDENYSYSVNFYSIMGRISNKAEYKSDIPFMIAFSLVPFLNVAFLGWSLHDYFKYGHLGLGTDLYLPTEEKKEISKSEIKNYILSRADAKLKICEHIISLKEETERELIKQANEKIKCLL